MKNYSLVIALTMLGLGAMNAQKLSVNYKEEVKPTKDLKKSEKKGLVIGSAYSFNKELSTLSELDVYTKYKTDEMYLFKNDFDQTGKLISSETKSLSELGDMDELVDVSFFKETVLKDLTDLESFYIKRPILAGRPEIKKGIFTQVQYDRNGYEIFAGFKFEEQNNIELEDKFWPIVIYNYDGVLIDKNYHLLGANNKKSVLGKGISDIKNGVGFRQYFYGVSELYVAGGLASKGYNKILSGVMNPETGNWLSKHTLDVGGKIGIGFNSIKLKNGDIGLLVGMDKKYKYFYLNKDGSEKNSTFLGIHKSGNGKIGLQSTNIIHENTNDNSVVVYSNTFEKNMTGRIIGLSMSKIVDGKEVLAKNYTNEDLEKKWIKSKGEKVKFSKIMNFVFDEVQELPSGDQLVFGNARFSNGGYCYLIFQLSNNLDLKATYAINGVEPLKGYGISGFLPHTLKKTKDGYYWITRHEVAGAEKGVQDNSSTSVRTSGSIQTTTTYTEISREDNEWAFGQVAKIDFDAKKISEVSRLECWILGEKPGLITQNGSLTLATDLGVVFIK